jgi:hypothetical protein
MLSRVFHDFRYSVRKFIRTPSGTLALLFTIALGIGSNISVYGFAHGLSRSSSPLGTVSRIVSIFGQDAHHEAGPVSYKEYSLLKHHLTAFEWIGAARVSPASVMIADQPAIVSVAALTPHLASALNLSMEGGLLISHRMWRTQFGGKAEVRGDQIRIDSASARVGGVAPNWLAGAVSRPRH